MYFCIPFVLFLRGIIRNAFQGSILIYGICWLSSEVPSSNWRFPCGVAAILLLQTVMYLKTDLESWVNIPSLCQKISTLKKAWQYS